MRYVQNHIYFSNSANQASQVSTATTGVSSNQCQEMPRTNSVIGKVGETSAAARYAATTAGQDFAIESEKPYAEVSGFGDLA